MKHKNFRFAKKLLNNDFEKSLWEIKHIINYIYILHKLLIITHHCSLKACPSK